MTRNMAVFITKITEGNNLSNKCCINNLGRCSSNHLKYGPGSGITLCVTAECTHTHRANAVIKSVSLRLKDECRMYEQYEYVKELISIIRHIKKRFIVYQVKYN